MINRLPKKTSSEDYDVPSDPVTNEICPIRAFPTKNGLFDQRTALAASNSTWSIICHDFVLLVRRNIRENNTVITCPDLYINIRKIAR